MDRKIIQKLWLSYNAGLSVKLLNESFHFPFYITFFDGFPFVVKFFALTKPNFNFN